jgi:hypothetical protein
MKRFFSSTISMADKRVRKQEQEFADDSADRKQISFKVDGEVQGKHISI